MDPKNTLHPSIAANALPKEGTLLHSADGSISAAPHPHARHGYIPGRYINDEAKAPTPMAKTEEVYLFKQKNHEAEYDSIARVRSFLPATDQYVIQITMPNYNTRDTIGRGAFHARAQHVGFISDLNPLAIDTEVIAAIQSEREYQNTKWVAHTHSVSEWVLILRKLLADFERVTVTRGDFAGTHELRQIATTAIVAMEQCGAPLRTMKPYGAVDAVAPHPKSVAAELDKQEGLLVKINELSSTIGRKTETQMPQFVVNPAASFGELVKRAQEGNEDAKTTPDPLHRGMGFSLQRIKEEEVNSYQRYVDSRTNGDTFDVQMNLHTLWMRNLGELRHQHAAVASFKGIA